MFAFIVLAAPAPAQVRPLSLADLCDGAERVLIGGITKVESRWQGNLIVTDVTVVPAEALKGQGGAPFLLTIPGGTVGGVTLHVSEAPSFAEGEISVLFLKSGTPTGVYGWYRGKYSVVADQVRELPGTSLAAFRSQIQAELGK